MAGKNQSSAGPQSWSFMPTGPCQTVPLAASTVTVTLGQYVSTAPYAPQCAFWNIGAATGNSHAFVNFGSTTVTTAATIAAVIAALQQMAPSGVQGDSGMQILSTGPRPQQYLAIGSAGTTTVYITPGEGSR